MRTPWLAIAGALSLILLAVGPAGAQDTGCCQFFTRAADGGTLQHGGRQCDDLTRPECAVLRPRSTFLRGWHCNGTTQRCTAKGAPSGPTPTPTAVARIGCCQLDNLRKLDYAVCGNAISEVSCLNNFAGAPTFCADCVCSSHADPGFELGAGACVTRKPTPTPTPVPAEPRGCCQLDNLRGAHSSICGNAVQQSVCLTGFAAQPTFCKNCVCSSHASQGFDLTRGVCVSARNGRPGAHSPHGPGPQHPGAQ